MVKPTQREVKVSLYGDRVRCRGRVGLKVVTAVFECDSSIALELFVVPFCYFGVREKRVMSACEPRVDAPGNVVIRRVVFAGWVVGVLPVAVLRLYG